MSKLEKDLNEIRAGFASGNAMMLRELGNKYISKAALENDSLLAELSVMAYFLHKMLSKHHIVQSHNWTNIRKSILESIELAIKDAKDGSDKAIVSEMKQVIQHLENIDSDLGHFVDGLYHKARVKQASSAYALGLSLKQSAQLTGTNLRSVQLYVGKTKIHDEEDQGASIRQRLDKLKKSLEESV